MECGSCISSIYEAFKIAAAAALQSGMKDLIPVFNALHINNPCCRTTLVTTVNFYELCSGVVKMNNIV